MKKILIFVYCGFLAFLVGSAVFASKTFDGAVENAYEKGMAYPQEVARLRATGWALKMVDIPLRAGVSSPVALEIVDRLGKPVTGAQVTMALSRLTQPEGLADISAEELRPGHYGAQVVLPTYGYWQVQAMVRLRDFEVQQFFKIYTEEPVL